MNRFLLLFNEYSVCFNTAEFIREGDVNTGQKHDMLWGRGEDSPQHLVCYSQLEVTIPMQCPYCDNNSTKVVDTREAADKVRRRRECSNCERRFTTYETAEKFDIKVIKRNGEKEEFDEEKIREGVEMAASKTELDENDVEEIIDEVKKAVRGQKEIKSEEIGDAVKEELKKRDEVAYVRFASVYDSFDSVENFKKEAEELQED